MVPVQNKGPVQMSHLEVGSKVLTANGSFQTLYGFAHHNSHTETEFLQIYTNENNNNPLEVSRKHLLFVEGKSLNRAAGVACGA